MRIEEIAYNFEKRYEIECFKRQIKKLIIDKPIIAGFISEAQQDIQRRLNIVEGNSIVELIADQSEYNLPLNFGKPKFVKLNTDVYVYYYKDFGYYMPSLSGSQEWGYFDGSEFSGYLKIPDIYLMAVIYYCMAQMFIEYTQLYEKELASLKQTTIGSYSKQRKYSIGGMNKYTYTAPTNELIETNIDQIRQWQIDDSDSGTPTHYSILIESRQKKIILYPTPDSTTTGAAMDSPIFKLRFQMTESSEATILEQYGSSETFTSANISESGNVITVTSSDGQFTTGIFVDPNNDDIGHNRVSDSSIEFYTYSGYGTFIAEIYKYE